MKIIMLHSSSIRNFAEAYAAEIRGLIDLYGEVILGVMEGMAQSRGIQVPRDSTIDFAQGRLH